MKIIEEYGAWKSPINAEMVAQSGTGSSALPRELRVDNNHVYWVELRPEEKGRYVIVTLQPDGSKRVITPEGFSTRSRVNEYGGGVYCVRDGTIIFVNDEDQRLYRQDDDRVPVPITPEVKKGRSIRYADGVFSPDGKWMAWVQERHEPDGSIHNSIVVIACDGSSNPHTLTSGHDFFSNPRFSPDGSMISWLTWDHPRMPWDGTELWTTPFILEDSPSNPKKNVAGAQDVSVFQPEWGQDGLLYFVSDETGWWNIFRINADGSAENLTPIEAEFGYPQWLFGFSTYTFLSTKKILAMFKVKGQAMLGVIDVEEKRVREVAHTYTTFENPSICADDTQAAWFFAGSPEHPPALCRFELKNDSTQKVLDLFDLPINMDTISYPEQIVFENHLGTDTYAYFYPPRNSSYKGPNGHQPPLMVKSHGGPTSSAKPHLQLEIQYWTSRGYAVVDVDYSGSIGYGRSYRERINGRMGVIDVDDCVRTAKYLVEIGAVDPNRLIIRGSSAGGYVTLCALTSYDLFAAGSSYYGIADLETLANYSHNFEAHYLDTLVGPYPEEKELLRQRSPIHQVENLNCPMILIQGLNDSVVPPNQSEQMVAALNTKGLAYAYLTFEGEGHGFKRSETISKALEAEDFFFRKVLGISLSDPRTSIEIMNL
jgi:dipeptidyl aminopeptidase/acylaminoacyl peptidase